LFNKLAQARQDLTRSEDEIEKIINHADMLTQAEFNRNMSQAVDIEILFSKENPDQQLIEL